ncbi:MAG TPA: polysaccharide biosynthesis C-terminal domain-containing protein, partial [Caulifigura sp.]|nr:polysaccharide biosynthesis C-terminal domain-containing protein [Caulifigura sp.]
LRQALTAIGDVKRPAYIDVAQAVANFVLSIVFVKVWGITGVAWGTLLPLVLIEGFVLFPYAMKSLGFETGRLVKSIVIPQVPVFVGLVVYCEAMTRLQLSPGWLNVGIVGAGAGAVLGVASGWRLVRPRLMAATAG